MHERLVRLVEQYNGKMDGDGYAVISNSNRLASELNREVCRLRDEGHDVGYKVGIISVTIDGKEMIHAGKHDIG